MRGWMTLAGIAEGYGIPIDQLYAKAGLPSKVAPTTKLNQVAKTYKIGVRARQDAQRRSSHAESFRQVLPKKSDHKSSDSQEVKGFMTLNEIALKNGVPKDWLLKKLNLPANTDARQPLSATGCTHKASQSRT